MRVALAGVSSVTLIFLAVSLLFGPLEDRLPTGVIIPFLVFAFIATVLFCYFAFNRRSERWPHLAIEDLEKQGLVVSTEFQAKRAFRVGEGDDGDLQYYLELNDGSVLFLSGQYLYDYEPIEDDPEFTQQRKFPCTEFVVKRHKTAGYVMEIVTSGTVFEPEAIAPPFTAKDYRSGNVPKDGAVIRNVSFDEIKRERLNHS